jgi:hypothetical protein
VPVEAGRATGGLGFPHATLPSETAITIAALMCRICSRVIRCLFMSEGTVIATSSDIC